MHLHIDITFFVTKINFVFLSTSSHVSLFSNSFSIATFILTKTNTYCIFFHSVLYGNKIKNLPTNVFRGLTSLQLLLLNANEISCIRKDSFKDLTSLNLLSLYDNNIQSLANGTFDSMKSIQTL